mgnify:FL=1
MVREKLLAYIWKTQNFCRSPLLTTDGRKLLVVKPGHENPLAGPDFFEAHIQIDSTLWVGHVEIHVRASDWFNHQHQQDKAYDNVVLHVVWDDDVPVYDVSQQPMPTLSLADFASKDVIQKHEKWTTQKGKWILCADEFHDVSKVVLHQFWDRLYVERLMEKTSLFQSWLSLSKNNWEAAFFVALAKGFGLQFNGMLFAQMALSIPWNVVMRSTELITLEALFMGQAFLLDEPSSSKFFNMLKNEYTYLQHKYKLNPIPEKVKFFRLRPPNFPTIRLSQLAGLLHKQPRIFNRVLEANSLEDFYTILDAKTSIFWETHYNFNTPSKQRTHRLTKSFKQLLMLNTIFPFLFHYYNYLGSSKKDKVLDWARQLPPEKNNYTSGFAQLGCEVQDALESQACIQLKTTYCTPKRCLQCVIGHQLLNL